MPQQKGPGLRPERTIRVRITSRVSWLMRYSGMPRPSGIRTSRQSSSPSSGVLPFSHGSSAIDGYRQGDPPRRTGRRTVPDRPGFPPPLRKVRLRPLGCPSLDTPAAECPAQTACRLDAAAGAGSLPGVLRDRRAMSPLPASRRREMAGIAGGARFAARLGELVQRLVEREVCLAGRYPARRGG